MSEFKHVSVLPQECMDMLPLKKGGIYVDGTLGGGGHTGLILKGTSPDGKVIGIDKDEEAIAHTSQKLDEFKDRLLIIQGNFMNINAIIPQEYMGKVDGILLDLGVSSYQLDCGERGFSFMHDGRLDMRMDMTKDFCARDVVNSYTEEQLTDIFYKYGEEKWSKRIAQFIVEERKVKSIETTFELVDIIRKAVPANCRKQQGIHFATRVFQAIRIEVNGELDKLDKALWNMLDVLKEGGRICVITFHSLEDRIVKQTFKKMENPCECPPKIPMCVCGKKSRGKVITRKPILPGENEINNNPRSRSAKLRVFEKTSN